MKKYKEFKDFDKVKFPPFGRCIYCGSTENLQREHILPFALSGSAVLPKSSCPNCAKITGQIEQNILRGPMREVRVYLRMRSRTKHSDAPKTAPITIIRDEKEEVINLPLEEHPILLDFPIFTEPAFFNPSRYENGIRICGNVAIRFGKSPKEVGAKFGADKISISSSYSPTSFARMIAKIAYSYVIAEGYSDLIDGEYFPVSSILGESDDIGMWVGTSDISPQIYPGILHRLGVVKNKEKGVLLVEVQLFADSQTPTYIVIIGRLKQENVAQEKN